MGDERNEAAWLEAAWRLRISLNVRSLSSPAVQYAVFSEDPVVQFLADLGRIQCAYQAQLNEVADSERREARRVLQLSAAWNHLFRAVQGDDVYLLAPQDNPVLMSNAPPGKKWLVTKPVQISGRTVSWGIPFEATAGKEVEVELAESNALDLAAFDNPAQR